MSTTILQKALTKEITDLNRRIDRKILTGKPYKHDARTHKLLLTKLYRVRARNTETLSLRSFLAL